MFFEFENFFKNNEKLIKKFNLAIKAVQFTIVTYDVAHF